MSNLLTSGDKKLRLLLISCKCKKTPILQSSNWTVHSAFLSNIEFMSPFAMVLQLPMIMLSFDKFFCSYLHLCVLCMHVFWIISVLYVILSSIYLGICHTYISKLFGNHLYNYSSREFKSFDLFWNFYPVFIYVY